MMPMLDEKTDFGTQCEKCPHPASQHDLQLQESTNDDMFAAQMAWVCLDKGCLCVITPA